MNYFNFSKKIHSNGALMPYSFRHVKYVKSKTQNVKYIVIGVAILTITLAAINPNNFFCNLVLNSQFLKLIFIFHLMRTRQKLLILHLLILRQNYEMFFY